MRFHADGPAIPDTLLERCDEGRRAPQSPGQLPFQTTPPSNPNFNCPKLCGTILQWWRAGGWALFGEQSESRTPTLPANHWHLADWRKGSAGIGRARRDAIAGLHLGQAGGRQRCPTLSCGCGSCSPATDEPFPRIRQRTRNDPWFRWH